MKKIEEYVRSIPDFPEEGIIFRDITSVLQDADGLHLAIDSMQALLDGVDFDVVVGAESRGFVFGTPIAYNLHKPFVLVRKKGKLPCETVSRSYDLEYGTAEIEMHKDSIKPGPESRSGGRSDRHRRNHRGGCEAGGGAGRQGREDHFPDGAGRPEGPGASEGLRCGVCHPLRWK